MKGYAMNYTESFDQFASRVSTMDLALYAGVGLILWILFKDKLNPVQKVIKDIINKFNNKPSDSLSAISIPSSVVASSKTEIESSDLFFKLVASWKQTRDLAVQMNCSEAIKVADEMFPFLSPNVCGKEIK
jgi:hypothetical protein